jgi:L-ascorbate metabolism protein UlaG (beta-lactamase superfamily)
VATRAAQHRASAPRSEYRNAHGATHTQPLLPLLWWRFIRVFNRRKGSSSLPPVVAPDPAALAASGAHLTWIGHATFALRLGGKVVVTDPVWRERIYYLDRLQPPGAPIEALPPVDVVTISHNHYDHLDIPSLIRLADLHDPVFLVPTGNGDILRKARIRRVREMGWWDHVVEGDLRVTCVPAQHWSSRNYFDVNRALWAGFVFEGPEGTAYNSGDTAYEARLFADIRARFQHIDWAMLPIGAYDPEWFLSSHHMCPEDAARALDDLGAHTLVPMHYGTFNLTDEPIGEPLERIVAEYTGRQQRDRLWALAIGETRALADRRDRVGPATG